MYDMKNMTKLGQLGKNAGGDIWKQFGALNEAVMADDVIPVKYKELIAVAVALTTQCSYCLEIHKGKAREAGATDEELAQTVFIAAMLRAGGAITHGSHLIDD